MRVEVIVTEDGIMLPQGNDMFRVVPDEDIGKALRAMNGGAQDKPKKARKKRTRNALGKNTEVVQ